MIPGLSSKHLLYLNLLLDTICWTILLPSLPGMQSQLGLSTISMGSISSLFSAITFASGTVIGRIADSIGRFKMLRLSLTSQLVGHLLILLSLCINSSTLFVLARCVQASCKSAMVVSQAILHDISPLGQNLTDLGTLMAFSNIAFVIGPIVGGHLYTLSPLLPSQFSTFIAVCGVLLLFYTEWRLREEFRYDEVLPHSLTGAACNLATSPHDEESNDVEAQPDPAPVPTPETASLSHYMHIKFAFQIGNALFESLMPQHAQQRLGLSSASIGGLLSWTGVLSAFSNLVLLRRLDASGQRVEDWLPTLAVGMGVGLALWAVSPGLVWLVLAASVITLAANLFLGVLQGRIGQVLRATDSCPGGRTPIRVQSEGDLRALLPPLSAAPPATGSASVFGLSSTADRAARIISPLVGSVVLERWGGVGLVGLAAAVLAYCLLLLRRGGGGAPRRPGRQAADKLLAAVGHALRTRLAAWRLVRFQKTE